MKQTISLGNQKKGCVTQGNETLEGQTSLIRALRGSLPYLEEFHHQIFVVCVNGKLLRRNVAPEIMEELALLHRVGIQLVLVHDSQQLNPSSLNTSSFPVAVLRKDLEEIHQGTDAFAGFIHISVRQEQPNFPSGDSNLRKPAVKFLFRFKAAPDAFGQGIDKPYTRIMAGVRIVFARIA